MTVTVKTVDIPNGETISYREREGGKLVLIAPVGTRGTTM